MHCERMGDNVKKFQENTKSTYALKSTNNVYKMIESDPGSIKSEANQRPSSSSQDTSSATSLQASKSAFGSKQSVCRSTRAERYLPNSPIKKTEVIGKNRVENRAVKQKYWAKSKNGG